MKIYILFRNPFPYGMAPSQHVTCEALGLKAAGADVEVGVFVPPLDQAKDDGLPARGVFKDIPYYYIHGKFRPSTIIGQIVNRFYNTVRTFFWGLKRFKKGDVVYSYGGDNLTLMLFTWAAHIRKAHIVVEFVEIPFYGDRLISRLRRWFCTTFIISHIDAFVCISHALLGFVKQYSRRGASMFLLPILVEADKEQSFPNTPNGVPYIIHTGSMNEQKDGISIILKSFSEFKKTDKTNCRLVFTGPDAEKESCKYSSMIEELGISDSVDLLGMIATRKELLDLQHHAALSIVYKVENIQTKYCFATKIGEILMAGVPLITTDFGEQNYYLHNGESAYIVSTGNEKELADTIGYVLSHPDQTKQIGMNGKSVAMTVFNPITQGKKLYDFFNSLK